MVEFIEFGQGGHPRCKLVLGYRRRIMEITLGSVITSAKDVRAFYTDGNVHEKTSSSNGGWLFHQILGDCMGLINGKRWDRIHSELWPTFMHRAVAYKGPEVQKLALEYIRELSKGETSIAVHSSALAQFPFFVTAGCIYGPMTSEEKTRLWKISNRFLSLMRYVLSGGIYRFQVARYIDGVMYNDLLTFQREWLEFNQDMHYSRSSWTIQTPIVSLWKRALLREISEKEVTIEYGLAHCRVVN